MTFETLLAAGRAALARAEWTEAEQTLGEAAAVAPDEAGRALASLHRASIPVLRGSGSADLRIFRENLLRRHSLRHVAIAGYYILMAAVWRHDREEAERYLPSFADAIAALGDAQFTLAAHDLRAAIDSMRGDHAAAIERERMAIADLETYAGPDAQLLRTAFLHNLAYNCLAGNRFADAQRYAAASITHAEELGRKDVLGQVLVTAAFAHLVREQLDEAQKLAVQAETIVRGQRLEQYAHYVQGEVARRRGERELAMTHFRRLEHFYPEIPEVAEILLSMNVAPFLLPE